MLRPPGSSSDRPRTYASNRRKTAETPDDMLRQLQRLPPNKKCADCNAKLPSCVNLTTGTFICMACAGIHRELNNRVKGMGHSTFTAEEVEYMKKSDNDKINAIWLARYNPHHDRMRPPEGNQNQQQLRAWIRRKYQDKAWYGGQGGGPPPGGRAPPPVRGGGNHQQQRGGGPQPTMVQIPDKAPAPAVDLFAAGPAPAPTNDGWDAFGGSSQPKQPQNQQDPFATNQQQQPRQQDPFAHQQQPPRQQQNQSFANFNQGPGQQQQQQDPFAQQQPPPQQQNQNNFASFNEGPGQQQQQPDPFAQHQQPPPQQNQNVGNFNQGAGQQQQPPPPQQQNQNFANFNQGPGGQQPQPPQQQQFGNFNSGPSQQQQYQGQQQVPQNFPQQQANQVQQNQGNFGNFNQQQPPQQQGFANFGGQQQPPPQGGQGTNMPGQQSGFGGQPQQPPPQNQQPNQGQQPPQQHPQQGFANFGGQQQPPQNQQPNQGQPQGQGGFGNFNQQAPAPQQPPIVNQGQQNQGGFGSFNQQPPAPQQQAAPNQTAPQPQQGFANFGGQPQQQPPQHPVPAQQQQHGLGAFGQIQQPPAQPTQNGFGNMSGGAAQPQRQEQNKGADAFSAFDQISSQPAPAATQHPIQAQQDGSGPMASGQTQAPAPVSGGISDTQPPSGDTGAGMANMSSAPPLQSDSSAMSATKEDPMDAFAHLSVGGETNPPAPSMNAPPPVAAATASGGEGKGTDENSQKYTAEQIVCYKSNGNRQKAKIVKVHLDDDLQPFYTINLKFGKEKQTDNGHLEPLDSDLYEKVESVLLSLKSSQLQDVYDYISKMPTPPAAPTVAASYQESDIVPDLPKPSAMNPPGGMDMMRTASQDGIPTTVAPPSPSGMSHVSQLTMQKEATAPPSLPNLNKETSGQSAPPPHSMNNAPVTNGVDGVGMNSTAMSQQPPQMNQTAPVLSTNTMQAPNSMVEGGMGMNVMGNSNAAGLASIPSPAPNSNPLKPPGDMGKLPEPPLAQNRPPSNPPSAPQGMPQPPQPQINQVGQQQMQPPQQHMQQPQMNQMGQQQMQPPQQQMQQPQMDQTVQQQMQQPQMSQMGQQQPPLQQQMQQPQMNQMGQPQMQQPQMNQMGQPQQMQQQAQPSQAPLSPQGNPFDMY